ncbi:MFS transporter [Halobellus limi]|uniref:Major Facilitator Superfamily protein n=1 Tax=Halobellus limi TaxID=699433 RepID=A0A1H5ZT54_9EURY|nr:MFS transporter [Halobellus limi]SEG38965.1 Major Facilitator Superfamily protein [Halobellus limi]
MRGNGRETGGPSGTGGVGSPPERAATGGDGGDESSDTDVTDGDKPSGTDATDGGRTGSTDGGRTNVTGHGPPDADGWLYGWALGYAAVGAASLLVPLYAIDLGAGALVVSLIAATAAFAGVPGAILWGRLVTRTRRRRPFVLVALGLAAGVFLLLPFLASPWTVLLANAALWFVVAAAAPVLNVIVVEGFDPARWTQRFGLLNHYQGYGWLAGLVAGGVWSTVAGAQFGIEALAAKRLFFVLSAVVALGGVAVVLLRYPEPATLSDQRFRRLSSRVRSAGGTTTRATWAVPFSPGRILWGLRDLGIGRTGGSRRSGRDVLSRLRTRFSGALLRYLLGAVVFFAGFSAFFGPLPAYLVDSGYATDEVFGLFILSAAASAAAYASAGTAASKYDPFRLQAGALLFRAGSFPIVAVVGAAVAPPAGLIAVGALFLAIGASWAVIAVTATGLVSRLAPDSVRAEALGVYTAVGSLGGGVGSVFGGSIADWVGYLPAFVVAGGFVVGGFLVAASARGTRPAST